MDKILHVASTFKSLENDDGSVMIRGMASTNHSDRAGDVISKEAWEKGGLENFKNNPVILFNHDYDKPIGRATGVKVTENGLELEAKISKSAPAAVCELVKDGVLGAFSVGFKVKDADYIKETDGLMIKDAELFEVSVVSVPCNQAATFSLAKSFDSQEEYNEFKKTFTNRVDLTGQSLTKEDEISSNLVSDTPTSSDLSEKQEIKMDSKEPTIDLEAFAKKVADETAAKIAMKQAEQKAADEAEQKAAAEAVAQKAAETEAVEKTIRTGIETGAERLAADMEADFAKAKDGELAEITKKYEADLKEKAEELEAMRKSKRDFSGRSTSGDLTAFGQDFLHASVVGKVLGKSMDQTALGQEVLNKANVAYSGAVNQVAIDAFEENIRLNYRVANFFKEMQVTAQKTVIPVGLEPTSAAQNGGGIDTAGNRIADGGASDGEYALGNVSLDVNRIIAGQFIDNNTDEQIVATVMPIIMNALAHAQAKKVEETIIDVIDNASATDEGAGDVMNRTDLLAGRKALGVLGVDPTKLLYILSVDAYNELLSEGEFDDVQLVGNDASKLTGTIGNFYGSPVVVSDRVGTDGDGLVVNTDAFIIPRMRGVQIETDYEVANQRTAIVSSQTMGFTQIISGVGSSVVRPAA